MKQQKKKQANKELELLCTHVRELISAGAYEQCEDKIKFFIQKFPHAPHPHNLYGVLLERQGDHLTAMKHFRVAWVLDATYLPARHNLEHFGTFFPHGKCAYDESDCPQDDTADAYEMEYDEHGVGHVVRRK